MFVLRRILNDVYVSNTIMGDTYSIYFKEGHPKDFNHLIEVNKLEDVADRIFAFIRDSNGQEHPLYKNLKLLSFFYTLKSSPIRGHYIIP